MRPYKRILRLCRKIMRLIRIKASGNCWRTRVGYCAKFRYVVDGTMCVWHMRLSSYKPKSPIRPFICHLILISSLPDIFCLLAIILSSTLTQGSPLRCRKDDRQSEQQSYKICTGYNDRFGINGMTTQARIFLTRTTSPPTLRKA